MTRLISKPTKQERLRAQWRAASRKYREKKRIKRANTPPPKVHEYYLKFLEITGFEPSDYPYEEFLKHKPKDMTWEKFLKNLDSAVETLNNRFESFIKRTEPILSVMTLLGKNQ